MTDNSMYVLSLRNKTIELCEAKKPLSELKIFVAFRLKISIPNRSKNVGLADLFFCSKPFLFSSPLGSQKKRLKKMDLVIHFSQSSKKIKDLNNHSFVIFSDSFIEVSLIKIS